MKKIIKKFVLIAVCIGASSCAHQTLKAPCGPTAGLTDPCGNSTPINGVKSVLTTDTHEAEKAIAKKV